MYSALNFVKANKCQTSDSWLILHKNFRIDCTSNTAQIVYWHLKIICYPISCGQYARSRSSHVKKYLQTFGMVLCEYILFCENNKDDLPPRVQLLWKTLCCLENMLHSSLFQAAFTSDLIVKDVRTGRLVHRHLRTLPKFNIWLSHSAKISIL